jgi:L-fucose mutarotase/ribose pyranase (RbsD/FucU family)
VPRATFDTSLPYVGKLLEWGSWEAQMGLRPEFLIRANYAQTPILNVDAIGPLRELRRKCRVSALKHPLMWADLICRRLDNSETHAEMAVRVLHTASLTGWHRDGKWLDMLAYFGIDLDDPNASNEVTQWQRGESKLLDSKRLPQGDVIERVLPEQIALLEATQIITDVKKLHEQFVAAENWKEMVRVAAIMTLALTQNASDLVENELLSDMMKAAGTVEDGMAIQGVMKDRFYRKAEDAFQVIETQGELPFIDMVTFQF